MADQPNPAEHPLVAELREVLRRADPGGWERDADAVIEKIAQAIAEGKQWEREHRDHLAVCDSTEYEHAEVVKARLEAAERKLTISEQRRWKLARVSEVTERIVEGYRAGHIIGSALIREARAALADERDRDLLAEQFTHDDQKGLLLVAVRVDDSREVQNRIKTVLAVASTYAKPPDTTAAVWCKSLPELTAADLDRLAGFIGWDRVRDLNIASVSADYADAAVDEVVPDA